MAFTIPNNVDASDTKQAQIDKVDIDIIIAASNMTGINSGCAVTAQSTPDMTVAVATGTAVLNGNVGSSVTAGNLTIGGNSSGNPRFDLICVDTAGAKQVVAGTAAAAPVFPAIPSNNICIAAIFVPNGVSAIDTPKIIDKRMFVKSVGDQTAQTSSVQPIGWSSILPWFTYRFDGTTQNIADSVPAISNAIVFNNASPGSTTKIGFPKGNAAANTLLDSSGDPVTIFQDWAPGSGHALELKGSPLAWLMISRASFTGAGNTAPQQWFLCAVTNITEHTNYWELDIIYCDNQATFQNNFGPYKMTWYPLGITPTATTRQSMRDRWLPSVDETIGANQELIFDEPYELAVGRVTELAVDGILSLTASQISGVNSGVDQWGGWLEILPD